MEDEGQSPDSRRRFCHSINNNNNHNNLEEEEEEEEIIQDKLLNLELKRDIDIKLFQKNICIKRGLSIIHHFISKYCNGIKLKSNLCGSIRNTGPGTVCINI